MKRARANILLGIEDITGQRFLEREKDELLWQKDVLLGEFSTELATVFRSLPISSCQR
jgi:hypothetical protein